MTGRHSRTKGAGGERELAKLLNLSRNARNGLEAGDLATPEGYGFSIEVKRRSRAYSHLYRCIEQAEGYNPPPGFEFAKRKEYDTAFIAANKTPIAIVRDDHASWLVVLRLSDAVELIPGLRVEDK